ncbi:rhamnogalacturonan acetylesterase [Caulobacter sp. DWR2-3-1b2]|uniref:rhamnogalacturonan acetylesterase n=1 Tax=Caulobacter sp. DWR2-3-1b2 TaxID=2804642 RepID=UPI003CE7025D
MTLKPLLLAAALLIATPVLAQAPADPLPFKATKIILVGDSTTAVRSGWGGAFCGQRVTSAVACVNLGRGGRSTKTYRSEGSWTLVLSEMKAGGFADTYVLIQFGHNDAYGRAERLTDLKTEFPTNLKRYVADVRAAGAHPVLVTPLSRRQFSDGKLVDDLIPWAQAIRAVAAETATPLVDLNARSAAAAQALGPVKVADWAEGPPSAEVAKALATGTTVGVKFYEPPIPGAVAVPMPAPGAPGEAPFDYTHLGPVGAEACATIVAEALAKAVPELAHVLAP